MKLTRFAAALTAVMTAVMPVTINTDRTVPCTVYAEGTTLTDSVAWIPKDFDSALEFRNTYGAVHIENGVLCIVFKREYEPLDPVNYVQNLRYELRFPGYKGTLSGYDTRSYTYSETPVKGDTEFIVIALSSFSKGDFAIEMIDTYIDSSIPDQRYSFYADDAYSIKETDIYGWLPDCEKEYWDYANKNTNLSAKDNYVVFCLSHNAGTAYDWFLNDKGKECFELETVSDCSPVSSVPVDGGDINMIYAYKAVKDGYDKISYDFGPVYAGAEDGKKSLVADCAVINDAQNILLSDDMRVSLVDYDTGELLMLPEGKIPRIWTDISKDTPEGKVYCNMQPVGFKTNPAVVDLGNFFAGYDFSFGLDSDNLPVGYSLPGTDEKSAGYYNGIIIPDDHITVTRYDNDSADVVFRLKKNNDIEEKSTKITFYDKDTGELINIPENDEVIFILKCPPGVSAKYEEIYIASNPCTINSLNIYDPSCNYYYYPVDLTDCYDFLEFEVISQNTNHIELSCKMELVSSGDVNDDNDFNVADVVLFQKWLLGSADAKLANWRAADFCRDNKLDIFDLIKMRQRLIEITPPVYVEPDHRSYAPARTISDHLYLYLGPDESYESVAIIPKNTALSELGYQYDSDKWIFTNYCGQYGWIRTVEDDDRTPTIVYVQYPDKPVIYLYPEQETDVHVELELTEAELSTTYPKYNNGWDVTAYPDGKLVNKADGTHHRYLFWDAVNCRTRFDYSKGFCVAGSDTESFLKEKLTYMGLTEEEMNEFIVYWLPLMEHNKYNLITFQGDVYTDSAKLNITPTPDSLLRIFMAYIPLEEAIDIEPQQLSNFERKGFTVVEWGGSKIQ